MQSLSEDDATPPQPLYEETFLRGAYVLGIYPPSETVVGCRLVRWWPVIVSNGVGRYVAGGLYDGCNVVWREYPQGHTGENVISLASMRAEGWFESNKEKKP